MDVSDFSSDSWMRNPISRSLNKRTALGRGFRVKQAVGRKPMARRVRYLTDHCKEFKLEELSLEELF